MKPDPIDEAIRKERAHRWNHRAKSARQNKTKIGQYFVFTRKYDTHASIRCQVCGSVIQKGEKYLTKGKPGHERHEGCINGNYETKQA